VAAEGVALGEQDAAGLVLWMSTSAASLYNRPRMLTATASGTSSVFG
jgi:hypothetical protein